MPASSPSTLFAALSYLTTSKQREDPVTVVERGLPKAAFEMGAVEIQCKPAEVASTILHALSAKRRPVLR